MSHELKPGGQYVWYEVLFVEREDHEQASFVLDRPGVCELRARVWAGPERLLFSEPITVKVDPIPEDQADLIREWRPTLGREVNLRAKLMYARDPRLPMLLKRLSASNLQRTLRLVILLDRIDTSGGRDEEALRLVRTLRESLDPITREFVDLRLAKTFARAEEPRLAAEALEEVPEAGLQINALRAEVDAGLARDE